MEYEDVFRVRLKADPPAKVEPLEVCLREGAVPYRAGVLRYPEVQRAFLREYVRELELTGLVKRNNSSRWACAALPVKKHDGGFRMTVDNCPVNQKTIPIAGAAPNLTEIAEEARGAYGVGLFDLLKGFWQAALAENSQEFFSFVTEDGIYTPTRGPARRCGLRRPFPSTDQWIAAPWTRPRSALASSANSEDTWYCVCVSSQILSSTNMDLSISRFCNNELIKVRLYSGVLPSSKRDSIVYPSGCCASCSTRWKMQHAMENCSAKVLMSRAEANWKK